MSDERGVSLETMLVPAWRNLPLDEVLLHYRQEGWARLGKLVSDETLGALSSRTEDIMLGRVPHESFFFQLDTPSGLYEDLTFGRGWEGPSLAYRKIEKLERDPLFYAYLGHPLFEKIARAWIAGPISLYRAVLFNKGEGGGSVLPWHQDGGSFWGVSPLPTLQIWTALDDAPEDGGCLEFVPGTHHAGLCRPFGGVVPAELALRAEAHARRVLVPAVRGEILLVHNHVWHRSLRSRTGQLRRGLSVCYMSAHTRCLRRRRAPREFVEVFGDHLAARTSTAPNT